MEQFFQENNTIFEYDKIFDADVTHSVLLKENERKKILLQKEEDYFQYLFIYKPDLSICEDTLNQIIDSIADPMSIEQIGSQKLGFNKEYIEELTLMFKKIIPHSIKSALNNVSELKLPKLNTSRVNIQRSYFDSTPFYNQLESIAKILNNYGAEDVKSFLKKWLARLQIADDIKIEELTDQAFIISLVKGDNLINLADVGYGVSQVLSVLFSVIIEGDFVSKGNENVGGKNSLNIFKNYLRPVKKGKYGSGNPGIAIEEPEANLHPANQSKLADLFVDAAKNHRLQFIIETHSEYLIRKLQYLTAKGEIKPEDTVIYYFYPPDDVPPGEQQVKKISIQEDGSLTDDFGTGFFDEADKIAMSIWNMNKSQKN